MTFIDPLSGNPLTRAELRKQMGLSPLFSFLEVSAITDVLHRTYDFDEASINTGVWAVANGGGAAAVSFAINVQQSGVIRGTTGTAGDATASASIISPKIYYGAQLARAMFRWKPITAITEARFELGFVDVVPGSTKSVINSLTSPTVNTSVVDAAIVTHSHTGSTVTDEIVTIGSAISAAKTAITPPTAIAAGTYNLVRLQLIASQVYAWMDGLMVLQPTAATAQILGTNSVCLWARVAASDGTSKSMDIDLITVTQNR